MLLFLEKSPSEIHVLSELPRRECCWGRILLSLAGFLFFFGQVFCLSFSLGKCLSLFGSLGFCYRLLSFLALLEFLLDVGIASFFKQYHVLHAVYEGTCRRAVRLLPCNSRPSVEDRVPERLGCSLHTQCGLVQHSG